MFHTDPVVFAALRDRWRSIEAEGTFEGIDPELIPMLKLFNQLPGVASFMSCVGHHGQNSKCNNYLSFAFNEQGLGSVTEVFARLRTKFVDRWPRHAVARQPTPRDLVLSFSVRSLRQDEEDNVPLWWNSGCINFHYRRVEEAIFNAQRDQYLAMFEEAIQETLDATKD